MIRAYTGKPGNGKSYHLARDIRKYLRKGKNVFCNVEIDVSKIKPRGKKPLGNFFFVDSQKMGKEDFCEGLMGFALNFHQKNKKGEFVKGKEGQSLLIMDEAQDEILLNARTWNNPTRREFNNFFSKHRHYSFDVLLVTQDIANLDKQTCKYIQYYEEHRKMANYKVFGKIITLLCGSQLFIIIKRDMALKRSPKLARMGSYVIKANKRIYDMYNSYVVVDTRR
ncbi:MAG: zonular occludens toxin domain-containing protein [Lachnospiraceae bacterium]|nr:zonular occludens toxin domain-containing protein [Lachnospiraceae bacterium]